MMHVSDIVRQQLMKLVPSALYKDITCFVLYDNHPRDDKFIDVIICTVGGEIKEFYKRDVVCSLSLDGHSKHTDIKILRNGNCELFYLVASKNELTIVSRRDKLCVHRRVTNVDRYEINDSDCRGQAYLKIICRDDAVPMVFDDNFENLGDKALVLSGIHAEDSLPILTQLMRKLTETKYSVKCNEETLKEFLSLRQVSALNSYQEIHPNTEESVFKNNSKMVLGDDIVDLKTKIPWVKICNKKIVIMLFIYNDHENLEDIQILLHGTNRPSIAYITRLFEKIHQSPFWQECPTTYVKKNTKDLGIVAVINIDEIKLNVTSKIEFNGVISFKKCGKEILIPFNHIIISASESMGDDFDVLSNVRLDEITTLSILATTSKTEMVLRHIRTDKDPVINIPELCCSHLHMEMVKNTSNTVIYRKSPYHILNGVMLVFERDENNIDVSKVLVYSRTPSQILSLTHYIHEAIPNKIIITTPQQRLTAKCEALSKYNEELKIRPRKINYEGYASSIIMENTAILEYFDNCMIKMSDSKDPSVTAKIGTEIDVFAPGVPALLKLRQNLLEENLKGIKSLSHDDGTQSSATVRSQNMLVD